MLLELLLGLQQVINVVGTKDQNTILAGNTHFVKFALHCQKVVKRHFLAGPVTCSGGLDYRDIGSLFVRGKGMDCLFCDFLTQCVAVAFLHAGHFIITASVQLIIGHRGCGGVELIQ